MLREASDAATSKASLPFLTGNKNWNNPSTLQGYRNLYQQNLNQWQWWASPAGQAIIGGVSAAATFFPLARLSALGTQAALSATVATGAGTSWASTTFINSQISNNQSKVNAISARLAVLNQGCQ